MFGAQYYMSLHHVHVKVWKKNHPTAVMFATFVIGSFLIYQVSSISQSREDNMIGGVYIDRIYYMLLARLLYC